jgi:ribonuclease MRP protein subunit RMP1
MELTPDAARALQQEYAILHLVWHRNKNQHRALHWWRYFNMLQRHVRAILNAHFLRMPAQVATRIAHLRRKKIMDKAYWEFNGIIALGQFVTLGLTLVGALAKIWSILCPADVERAPLAGHQAGATSIADDDMGEEVLPDAFPESQRPPPTPKQPSSPKPTVPSKRLLDIDDILGRKRKKKSKKKRSEIDDIFG